MNKKKLIIVGIVIIVLLVLLFPVKLRYKDGGSVCYRALLYSVTKWHQLDDNQVDGYKDGLEIKILGMTVCDRSYDDPVSEKPNTETGNVVNFQNNTIEPAVSAPNEDEDEKSFTYNIAFANWTDDSKIYAAALNGKAMLVSSVQHLPVYKFDTAPELDTFKTTYGDILTMDQGLDETPSFSYITAAYDDSFFSRYSILLAYVPTSSSSYRFGVSDVYCDGQSFCMYIE